MARVVSKDLRCYIDGYDLSSYVTGIGNLNWDHDFQQIAGLSEAVKGGLPGQSETGIETINGVFDSTATSGLHTVMSTVTNHHVMIPFGVAGAPAAGDFAYFGRFEQLGYQTDIGDGLTAVNMKFGMPSVDEGLAYEKPWGVYLHTNSAATAENTAVGIDDYGSATTGGYMMYQIFSVIGTGTVTIKVQHAETNSNGSFADLGGCTSGAVAHTSIPAADIKETTAITTDVYRYLRWQLALDTITSCTFALAFMRDI